MAVVNREEIKAFINGNEILITPVDISRLGLGDEGTTNLEIGPIDPKRL